MSEGRPRARPQPTGPAPPPAVVKIAVRYGKLGTLRFASHRVLQRAFERAVRRAALPIAYSAGFTPHPRLSYLGAAPTGAASQAEYLLMRLSEPLDGPAVAAALGRALPPEMPVYEAQIWDDARQGALAAQLTHSLWRLELPELRPGDASLARAAAAFWALDTYEVEQIRTAPERPSGRRTSGSGGARPAAGGPAASGDGSTASGGARTATGRPAAGGERTASGCGATAGGGARTAAGELAAGGERTASGGGAALGGGRAGRVIDVRGAVVALAADTPLANGGGGGDPTCAILDAVVRQATPAVRPKDIFAALANVGLDAGTRFRAFRLAQGQFSGETGVVTDPLSRPGDGASTGV